MNPKVFWLITAIFLALLYRAEAQQPKKIYRVGYLSPASATTSVPARSNEAYRQRLRELGWNEGQNFFIEYRFADGKTERFPELAADLVRLYVDCIVAFGVAATRAAKQATSRPIIMGNADDDPVKHGLVASLARPGGNVTGFTNVGSDLAGKRVVIIKEIIPTLSRLGILFDSRALASETFIKETENAAKPLGIKVRSLGVRASDELNGAFQIASKDRFDAISVVATGLITPSRDEAVTLTGKSRLPAVYSSSSFPFAGGLISYASDDNERFRSVADYVDKVLKGTNTADLPVLRPKKFELVINLKTAKQIGLTIPPNVLARADKVIK
jgi:putative ABC transport system substrate-binding protein